MALRSLIVDDNSQFLAVARDVLERDGIEVVGVATSGAEAVGLAAELRPDVALVDVDLGEESGLDVAERLVREPGADGLRVLLISTYPEADFAELIPGSAAVGFLPKPKLSAENILKLLNER